MSASELKGTKTRMAFKRPPKRTEVEADTQSGLSKPLGSGAATTDIRPPASAKPEGFVC